MAFSDLPKPSPIIGSRSRDVAWYSPKLNLPPVARELLEEYSHIPPEEVDAHVLKVRDLAWEIFPFPCIGEFRFIDLSLCRSPSYQTVLKRLNTGAKLLDMGCCVAQDLRKLVHDGAPASNLYGAELEAQFIDLGFQLFLDKDRLGDNFLVADLFDETGPLHQLQGKMDMIFVGLFLHLFDWAGQVRACKRIVQLLRDEKGVLVLGQQLGHLESGEFLARKGSMWRHNAESFENLWREVGESTGTSWEVRARLDTGLGIGEKLRQWDDEKTRRLVFEVERLT